MLEEFEHEGGFGDGVVVGEGRGFEIDDFDVAAGFEGAGAGVSMPPFFFSFFDWCFLAV